MTEADDRARALLESAGIVLTAEDQEAIDDAVRKAEKLIEEPKTLEMFGTIIPTAVRLTLATLAEARVMIRIAGMREVGRNAEADEMLLDVKKTMAVAVLVAMIANGDVNVNNRSGDAPDETGG